MNDKYSDFQKENNEILRYILEDRYFSKFNTENINKQKKTGLSIEFFITSVCNQKCEYCYLKNHGDELYPPDIRNIDVILKNERIILEYLLEKDVHLFDLDLFSGEIWGMKFGNDVLDIILEYIKKGLKIDNIMIPSNCSFVLNKQILKVVQAYIDEFRKNGTNLRFSASVEGKYLENITRQYKNSEIDKRKNSDEYYDTLLDFCFKNGYGFHPMVSAAGIEHWIENYKWWMDFLKRRGLSVYEYTMFLEVRNDDWTKDKINKYLKFLDYVFDYMIKELYHNDIKKMIEETLLKFRDEPQNYKITQLASVPKAVPCSVGRVLCIRLGDLAICPCHRLSYDNFLYGNFVVENGKICGVEAKNIQLANKILYTSSRIVHKCDSCVYNIFCMKGCYGANFEATNDPLIQTDSVCDLMKAKINYTIRKYEKIGAFDILRKYSSDKIEVMALIKKLLYDVEIIKSSEDYKEYVNNEQ